MKKYAVGLIVGIAIIYGILYLENHVPTCQVRLSDGRIVNCKEASVDNLGRGWWKDMNNNKHEESSGMSIW